MLVLKAFKLDENADEFLHITGRREGIMAYIFNLVGIDTTTELRCNSKNLMFKTASLRKGQSDISVPNSAVTAVATGFHKPFKLLVVAALFLLLGFSFLSSLFVAARFGFGAAAGPALLMLICFAIAVLCVYFYYITKSILFGVYNGGDHPIAAIYIKRSVIEGVSIDFEKYQKAADLLNKAVLESHYPKS
jgi:hypothetical protein